MPKVKGKAKPEKQLVFTLVKQNYQMDLLPGKASVVVDAKERFFALVRLYTTAEQLAGKAPLAPK